MLGGGGFADSLFSEKKTASVRKKLDGIKEDRNRFIIDISNANLT